MTAKYVRHVSFEVDLSFLPSDDSGQIRGEARAVAVMIEETRRAVFLALSSHVHDALRKAKRPIGELPLRDVCVFLSAEPRPEPEADHRHGRLEVDIARDPRALLSLGTDNATVGEWVIETADLALNRLKAWDSRFPSDVVREGIEAFRTGGYAFSFRAGERMIPGTQVKGRLNVVVSCLDTRRYFTALYRNKPLFRVEVPGIDRPDVQTSNHFPGVELDHGIITIPGHKFWPLAEHKRPDHMQPVKIDLRDHPEAFAFMREKGWIGTPADR